MMSTMLSAQRAAASRPLQLKRACTQRGGTPCPGPARWMPCWVRQPSCSSMWSVLTFKIAFVRLDLLRQQPSEIETRACSLG